jgi:hypothetical protein
VQDNAGNFYASDTNHNIRKIAPDGTISTFAGTGVAGATIDGSTGTLAAFKYPYHMAYDGVNEVIYVAVSGSTSIVALFTGNASTKLVTNAAGAVRGIAVDASGAVYTSVPASHAIYRTTAPLSSAPTRTLFLGSSGSVSGTTNGAGTSARFYAPVGLSIASQPTTDQAMFIASASCLELSRGCVRRVWRARGPARLTLQRERPHAHALRTTRMQTSATIAFAR